MKPQHDLWSYGILCWNDMILWESSSKQIYLMGILVEKFNKIFYWESSLKQQQKQARSYGSPHLTKWSYGSPAAGWNKMILWESPLEQQQDIMGILVETITKPRCYGIPHFNKMILWESWLKQQQHDLMVGWNNFLSSLCTLRVPSKVHGPSVPSVVEAAPSGAGTGKGKPAAQGGPPLISSPSPWPLCAGSGGRSGAPGRSSTCTPSVEQQGQRSKSVNKKLSAQGQIQNRYLAILPSFSKSASLDVKDPWGYTVSPSPFGGRHWSNC